MKPIYAALVTSMFVAQAQAAEWQPLPDAAPAPADNPTSDAKVELGKMLYMDPRFSSTGTVSCNSCHNVMEGGDDSRSTSMGVHGKTGGRNAPTVWNSAFHSVQFWDGRAATLEEQAKGPVANPVEMGMKDVETAMDRVRKIPGYKAYFDKAFGENSMTVDNAAKAVAAFERTLITPNSPYDKYVKGDKKAMSEQQVRGMEKFASTGCTACHSGPAFNGPQMKLGEGFYSKFPTFADNKYVAQYKLADDKGRQDTSGKEADADNEQVARIVQVDDLQVGETYRCDHLGEAVRVMAKTQLNKDVSDADVADIVAFLGALTGEYPELTMPRLPATAGTSIVAE